MTVSEINQMSPLESYLAHGLEMAPHLKIALQKLSLEHPSGIAKHQQDTPMMKQYIAAKDEVVDALIFFRMGDFFELFGADAIIAADICSLTLTSRDKSSDNPIPMAGVPACAYRAAIKKCLVAGYKVAIVDQVEDPRLAKGLVRREIVRIATPAVPGDWGEDESSSDVSLCYLAAAHETTSGWLFAYVDVSTGEFRATHSLSLDALKQELCTISPKEIIVKSDKVAEISSLLRNLFQKTPIISPFETWVFRSEKDCHALVADFLGKNGATKFGITQIFGMNQLVAGVLAYLKNTQRDIVKNIQQLEIYELNKYLKIDDATKKHLDFFITAHGERRGSLYWFLNQGCTAAGSRLLARKLNYPHKNIDDINNEHDAIDLLLKNKEVLNELTLSLKRTADLEKLLARAAQNSLDSRGLVWLRATLLVAAILKNVLNSLPPSLIIATFISQISSQLLLLDSLISELQSALVDEPAAMLGKGGKIFREGYSPELDEITQLEANFEAMLSDLEKRERDNAQISTLKIGYTRVFGYYFEVSKGKIAQAPAHFIRKQTLANAERYTTPELKELEDKALSASERRLVLERELFENLRVKVVDAIEPIKAVAVVIASIDMLCNFAVLAFEHKWCRPMLTENPVSIFVDSEHPILKALQISAEPFIANTVACGNFGNLSPVEFEHFKDYTDNKNSSCLLITGPNMAGKSTIMRQVALTQVLGQIGCFVPAKKALLGVCDRILTRIGASDFVLKNQSTFMVEMLETAHMLRVATKQSLLLLDELGRGTSTFDGLSLAWAIIEDIYQRIGARTLFSTHYHELLEVAASYDGIIPMQMEVIERERTENLGAGYREILFSRKFIKGAAGKSYGLHVAELAGIPANIIVKAAQVLENLTSTNANLGVSSVLRRTASSKKRDIATGASIFDFNPSSLTQS